MNLNTISFENNLYVDIETTYPMQLLYSYGEPIMFSNITGEVTKVNKKSIVMESFDLNIDNLYNFLILCDLHDYFIRTNIDNQYTIRTNIVDICIGDIVKFDNIYVAKIYNFEENESIVFLISNSFELCLEPFIYTIFSLPYEIIFYLARRYLGLVDSTNLSMVCSMYSDIDPFLDSPQEKQLIGMIYRKCPVPVVNIMYDVLTGSNRFCTTVNYYFPLYVSKISDCPMYDKDLPEVVKSIIEYIHLSYPKNKASLIVISSEVLDLLDLSELDDLIDKDDMIKDGRYIETRWNGNRGTAGYSKGLNISTTFVIEEYPQMDDLINYKLIKDKLGTIFTIGIRNGGTYPIEQSENYNIIKRLPDTEHFVNLFFPINMNPKNLYRST